MNHKRHKKLRSRILPLFLVFAILSGLFTGAMLPARETVYGMDPVSYYTLWDLFAMMFETAGYSVSYSQGKDGNYSQAEFDRMLYSISFAFQNADDPEVRRAWLEIYDEINKISAASAGNGISAVDLAELTDMIDLSGLHLTQEQYDALQQYADLLDAYKEGLEKCPDFDGLSLRFSLAPEVWSSRNSFFGTLEQEATLESYVSLSAVPYDTVLCVYNDGSFYAADIYIVSNDPFSYAFDSYQDGSLSSSASCPNEAISADGYYYARVWSYYASFEYEVRSCLSNVFNGTIYDYIKTLPDVRPALDPAIDRSDMGCPAEVPDVKPWIKHPAIPDEWRIVQPGETPDPDDNKEEVPAIIIPFRDPSIDPGNDPNKDPNKDPDSTQDYFPDLDPDNDPSNDPNKDPSKDPDKDPDKKPEVNPGDGGGGGDGGDDDPSHLPAIAGDVGDWKSLFPLCIPWDIIQMVKMLNAKRKAPVWKFQYDFRVPGSGKLIYSFKLEVDMSDYWEYIKIFRWGQTVFFIIALFFLSAKITTFVYKLG